MSTPVHTSPALRRTGLEAVLGFAWRSGAFTAGEAMESVPLTRSTTIDVIDELTGRGILRELANARVTGGYRKGRPARRFELRSDAGVVVGVDAGRAHLTATVADLRGTALLTVRAELRADDESAEARADATQALIDDALATAGIGRDAVIAVCLGVPAPVDAGGDSPPHPTGFWWRMNPGFVEQFARWAPVVRVENDASLAAIAERSLGAAIAEDDFVTLLAGERLGAGICVDGRLLRGAHGGVGEMDAFTRVDGVGGAWGLAYRTAEWAREAVAAGGLPEGSRLADLAVDDMDARLVLSLAAAGDPGAVLVARRVGELLAVVAGVLAGLFDSRLIVVAGGVAEGAGPVIDAARAALSAATDLPAPRLVASTLGADVVSTGAVAAAVESARARLLDLPRFAVSATDGADAATV